MRTGSHRAAEERRRTNREDTFVLLCFSLAALLLCVKPFPPSAPFAYTDGMRIAVIAALALLVAPIAAQPPSSFHVDETTIADIHAAMRGGTLTCHALVQVPGANRRVRQAGTGDQRDHRGQPRRAGHGGSLDRRFAGRTGRRPLHCVPMIVKDNFRRSAADRGGDPRAQGLRAVEGRVPGAPHQGSGRHRVSKV